ncbi:battenin isoform X1 [Electrophorus electricus]|uniref:battenin isoform X1 n=1 Tax=Electrophorus electricus TaxID=8005 RepID=UPI0015D05CBC|nr:battenin isoform X1 [Electrophorus electricus]
MDTSENINSGPDTVSEGSRSCQRLRNQSGFWLLGLCNNFAYVVMLSAAHDILKQQESQNTTLPTPAPGLHQSNSGNSSNSSRYDCNPVSTAAVLLADVIPTLLIKITAPFFIHKVPYGCRVLTCVTTATASFLVVSFSSAVWMSILGNVPVCVCDLFIVPLTCADLDVLLVSCLGVMFASVSSGLGELSFLSLTVYFSSDVLSGWGSGTGGAGVAGALMYSALTQAGLSPRVTLLVMLLVPVVMAISYFILLVFPPSFLQWKTRETQPSLSSMAEQSRERRPLLQEDDSIHKEQNKEAQQTGPLTFSDKLHILKGLRRFILPLALVYFAEYFINQGLLELLYFRNARLSHAEQYRWYQTLYQIGVFISRTSLYCIKIKKIWWLSVLQCVNAVLLFFSVYYQFLPSVWLVFVIVLYEGLLGGAAYVNIFYMIHAETGEDEREFAMAAASVGDSFGIALSGLAAFPVHSHFCSL